MRLLRHELYKIWSRKMVKISFVVLLLLQIFLFVMGGPIIENNLVDGKEYHGLAAIQKDREVTAEFAGELTDEKINAIVAKYGFWDIRKELLEDEEGGNYLQTFLFYNGLCDGSMRDWNNISNPTTTYPLAETAMGVFLEKHGITPELQYVRGWDVFDQVGSFGAMLTCLFLIIALSSVFSEEYTIKTANILLTTVHGKKKDIGVKIAAAFLIALGTYVLVEGMTFLLCGVFYGWQGLGTVYGYGQGMWYDSLEAVSVSFLPYWKYFLIMAVVALIGIVILTAFILLMSAVCRQPFNSLIASLIFYVLPAGIWFLLRWLGAGQTPLIMLLRRAIGVSPLYSGMSGILQDSLMPIAYIYRAVMLVGVGVPCVVLAYRAYRNHQVA